MSPDKVTACLVTRGDVDMRPILETLPFNDVVVWDNSKRPADLKTFGRFAATLEARHDVVYFQDDDCIFRDFDALLDAYEPGVLTAVYGHGENPDGYEDVAIFPGGAVLDRSLPWAAFNQYLRRFPCDDGFLYDCDFVFGALTPHVQLHLPFEIRDVAYNGRRLADEPWQKETKLRITNQARSLR